MIKVRKHFLRISQELKQKPRRHVRKRRRIKHCWQRFRASLTILVRSSQLSVTNTCATSNDQHITSAKLFVDQ